MRRQLSAPYGKSPLPFHDGISAIADDSLPTPDSLFQRLLEHFFESPSLVVSTYGVLVALWAWWRFGRGAFKLGSLVLDRSYDTPFYSSFKVWGTLRTALSWLGLYLPASFVTQIWAGSQYSPGQGGGFGELVKWSLVFGAAAVLVCALLVPSEAPRFGDRYWVPLGGLFGGYGLGMAWAVYAFSMKGGPSPGDWWVCPAMSCIGVAGSALRVRMQAATSRRRR